MIENTSMGSVRNNALCKNKLKLLYIYKIKKKLSKDIQPFFFKNQIFKIGDSLGMVGQCIKKSH